MTPYIYSRVDKTTGKLMHVERRFPIGLAPEKVRVGGRVYRRNVVAEKEGQRKSSCWPITSAAMGVMPSEIERDRKELAAHGIKVDHTKSGDVIVPDAGTHRKLRRVLGLRDRKSYVE